MHFKALKKKKKQVFGLKEVAMAPIQNQSGKSEGRARGSSPIWDEELSLKEKILKLRN